MASRFRRSFVSYVGLTLPILRYGSGSADLCASNGGAMYNDACYVFADPSVSCTDKCVGEGASCVEDALDLSHPQCESVLTALGVDISSTTSSWYYNFGPGDDLTSQWLYSVFDGNFVELGNPPAYKTSGCVVSPTWDATDQGSYTSNYNIPSNVFANDFDEAKAHNFLQETPTCDGASAIFRRVCSCFFQTAPPTPAPTAPAPTTPAPTTPAPTTPAPTTPASTTPVPTTPSPTTPAPATPTPTHALVEQGYWRTGEASSDVRACPIPHLCEGGIGGGDDLCVGNNTGPYCQVCPSSYYSSVNGVCVECGSFRGVNAVNCLGVALAALLLLKVATFVGSTEREASATGEDAENSRKESVSMLHVHATQHAFIEKLREKLVDLGPLLASVREDLLDSPRQRSSAQVEHLVVTTEMFAAKLVRLLPVLDTEPSEAMKKTYLQADLLCPVIDQLASAFAGLPGAIPGEEATIVAQIQSSLATARMLDPSNCLRDETSNGARNVAKVVVSFVQLVAATSIMLVVRRPNNLRSFLGGLDMVNLSAPKIFAIPCIVRGNFYDELVFKTVGPLVVVAMVGSVQVMLGSSISTDNPRWRELPVRLQECLLALAYFALTPATNAALRALSCEAFDDGRTKLRADYSIDCDAAEHTAYRVLAIIMAMVYPIGSLAAFSAVLWKHRDMLYPSEVRGRSKDDNSIAQQAKRANISAIQPSGILHDAYEPRAWWFEIFDTGRRIILASLVCFTSKPIMQLWLAMGFTVLCLTINIVFSPFVKRMDDCLYSGTQFVGLAVFGLALVAETDGEHGDKKTSQSIGWCIVVLLTGYIVAALVVVIMIWSPGTKDEMKVEIISRGAGDGDSMANKDDDKTGRRASFACLEEGPGPEEETPTPRERVKDSITDKQSSITLSSEEYGANEDRFDISENSTGEDEGGPANHYQTQVRGARAMGWSRRVRKSAGTQPSERTNSKKGTVAPTDEDLPDEAGSSSQEKFADV